VLHSAVIDEQRAFVAWWDASVTPGKRVGGTSVGARQQIITVTAAAAETGVTKPQVSKWRKRLADENAYRESLREGAADLKT
jgi:hypothetical protein